MTRYLDLTAAIAARIADGELPGGAALPSVREMAAQQSTTPATVRRAYAELADAGAIRVEPRRSAKVAANGALSARGILRGVAPFRLAGSDDPALSLLRAALPEAIAPAGMPGSYSGLSALWSGRADGAALHLRHAGGEYNAPFARGLLRGRAPVLVHLWRREQGLVLPAGNPLDITSFADLDGRRVVRRPRGTGTRALHDRLAIDAGLDPDAIAGPQVQLHLDVALAVATAEADAGLGLRGPAEALGLDFLPVVSEPFEVVTTEAEAGGLSPLLRRLAEPATAERIRLLGGYDLTDSGSVLPVG